MITILTLQSTFMWPGKWKSLKQFTRQLKAPKGFDHISNHPGYDEEVPYF